jgi:hypothetical protein
VPGEAAATPVLPSASERCSTAHYANRDYTAQRVMRRITLSGDRPRGPR